MESTEYSVENHQAAAVIAFEMFVVKVMEVAATLDGKTIAEFKLFEACMGRRCIENGKLDLEECICWVQGEKLLHNDRREIDQVFDWVHGES